MPIDHLIFPRPEQRPAGELDAHGFTTGQRAVYHVVQQFRYLELVRAAGGDEEQMEDAVHRLGVYIDELVVEVGLAVVFVS